MMKENSFKTFIKDTYQTQSPIPYIITAQAIVFVLIHIIELVSSTEITDKNLFSTIIHQLSLPNNFLAYIQQPWSLVTHTTVYTDIFKFLFDCLWLYWVGNLFLTFLNQRQFWTVFAGGIIFGSLIYLALGHLNLFNSSSYWNSTSFGLAALISSVSLLTPNLEVRLFIFGNVRLKNIAIVYLGLEALFIGLSTAQAVIPYLMMIAFGVLFMVQLNKGKDWSKILRYRKSKKLKIVRPSEGTGKAAQSQSTYLLNQEEIDRILDKISQSGYDNLTSHEKEILFRASKQD